MRPSRTRLAAGIFVVAVTATLAGCSDIFPSFAGVFGIGSTVEALPVTRVTARVACELQEFFNDPEAKQLFKEYKDNPGITLDTTGVANVSLTLQTDHSGSVQYTGIDLNKAGLTSIANLITATKGVSSLQAKFQPKTSVSAQIDITIPQTKTGLKQACPLGRAYVSNPLEKLYLTQWLVAFFKNIDRENQYENNLQYVCLSKITLKTSFQVGLDVSAGANPFFGTVYLLPVSGVTLDYNPDMMHSLQIVLTLKNNSALANALCKKGNGLQPTGRGST